MAISAQANPHSQTQYIEEEALVVSIKGDMAWVQTQSRLTCASCRMSDTCGNGILERFFATRVFETPVLNSLSAQVGDKVIIQMMKSSITKASLVLYLIPILLLLIMSFLAQVFDFSENMIILSGFIGLGLGLALIKVFHRGIHDSQNYQPELKAIISRPQEIILQTSCEDKTSNQ